MPSFFYFLFFINLFILFIYFWLRSVFVAAHGLSVVAASGATLHCGVQVSHCSGFSCGARALGLSGFSSCGTRAQ